VTELFDHRSFFSRKACKSLTSSAFFLTGEISPKREFQNQKLKNEVIFESFSLSQKVKTEKRKEEEERVENHQIFIFGFVYVCNQKNGRMIQYL
jgi:hypothetical protein